MKIKSFENLADVIFRELSKLIATHEGLEIFAVERAKFEGWVKVELVGILKKYFKNVVPEENNIDIIADEWAIELKTVNTNYRHPLVKNKHRPITKNIEGVLKDIKKLKNSRYRNKAVLFVVFPLPNENSKEWKYHLNKIRSNVRKILSHRFTFRNGVPATMYLGYI